MVLPLELLTEIFKYNEDDYKTLYSCVLINKQWHNASIPILWKNPFYFKKSTKIMINCLLEEDKDFLIRNRIELTFTLLKKPPLYNYAKFCTRLYFIDSHNFQKLIKTSGLNIFQNRLVKFILDHSAIIREFNTANINCDWINNYHGFDNSFQNLNKLYCKFTYDSEFIDRLATICKCIQSLKIYFDKYNSKFEDSLTQLIRAQNQIKQLVIRTNSNLTLTDNFKQAILTHSQSIIHYSSREENNIDHILLPTLYNLKTLSLTSTASSATDNKIKWLKNILLPNIESVRLCIYYQPFLSNLSNFININGKTLKHLYISGIPNDGNLLRQLFQSISQCCENLVDLSIFYKDQVYQELIEIFNNCIKLESIQFKKLPKYSVNKIDGGRILAVFNQTLPKALKSIIINQEISNISNKSFNKLMKNWRGPKPFTIKFERLSENSNLDKLIKRYQDLGFLN